MADIISAVVGLILCAYVWFTTATFPEDAVMKIGPDFFPRILVIAMVIACGLLLFQALTTKIVRKAETLSFKDAGIQRALLILALALVYISVMEFLGFIIATVLCMVTMMYILKLRKVTQMLLVSLGTAIAVNLAFTGFLDIQLPFGLLESIFG